MDCGNKKGAGEGRGKEDSQRPARVPSMLWEGGLGRAPRCFPLSPRWASKPLSPLDGDWGVDK